MKEFVKKLKYFFHNFNNNFPHSKILHPKVNKPLACSGKPK